MNNEQLSSPTSYKWISLRDNIRFIFSRPTLIAWSIVLLAATALVTFLGYTFILSGFEALTGNFFKAPPNGGAFLQFSWHILLWLYLISTRLVSFYIALLLSYTVTFPAYMFLSNGVEKIDAGDSFDSQEGFDISIIIDDLLEGVKIALFGIVVSLILFFVTFLPVLGTVIAFVVFIFYSTLLFIDFPASRRHWTLSAKLRWLYAHPLLSLRIGFIPALVGMVPIMNVLFIALLSPVLTVHATRNFVAVTDNELQKKVVSTTGQAPESRA